MNNVNYQKTGDNTYQINLYGEKAAWWSNGIITILNNRKMTSQDLSKLSNCIEELETEITHSSFWAK